MENEQSSHDGGPSTALQEAVFEPLERAIAEGTDPLTLLDTEDALRSIGSPAPSLSEQRHTS